MRPFIPWRSPMINADREGNFLQIPAHVTNVKGPGSHLFRRGAANIHGRLDGGSAGELQPV